MLLFSALARFERGRDGCAQVAVVDQHPARGIPGLVEQKPVEDRVAPDVLQFTLELPVMRNAGDVDDGPRTSRDAVRQIHRRGADRLRTGPVRGHARLDMVTLPERS